MNGWQIVIAYFGLLGLAVAFVWPLIRQWIEEEAAWVRRIAREKRMESRESTRRQLRRLPPNHPIRRIGEAVIELEEYTSGDRKL